MKFFFTSIFACLGICNGLRSLGDLMSTTKAESSVQIYQENFLNLKVKFFTFEHFALL